MVATLVTSAEMRSLAGESGPQLALQRQPLRNYGSSSARVTNEARGQRILSESLCSTSGQPKRKASERRVRSSLSSEVDDGTSGKKTYFLRLKRLSPSDGDQSSSSGRNSSTAIGSLPDEQKTRAAEEASSSSASEIARPQPVNQGIVDSPFVGEFAMELTAAVGSGLAGAVGGSGLADYESMTVSLPAYHPRWIWYAKSAEHENVIMDKAINATIVGSAAVLAITKMLTIDHDYWHGWTLLEILQYAPRHNWFAYEELLRTHPVFAKMMISGTVYSIGDWIAQCVEGKPVLEFNRLRVLRSGLVGFCLHGSLSHFYYHFCEWLFPFQGWWVLPLKVGFDQTIWSGIWNSIYFATLGLLRLESPVSVAKELREKFFPLLTAGWKLWPFAHIITYGVVPVEQRLLWVDMVEIIWVTILAMFANEKAEARIAEAEEVVSVIDTAISAVSVDEVMSSD